MWLNLPLAFLPLRPGILTIQLLQELPNKLAGQSRDHSQFDSNLQRVARLLLLRDRNLGYALGATDYVTKPVDRDRLAALVRKYRRQGTRDVVLLVEDDPGTRDMLRKTLEREGWDVAEAANGRIGLQQVAANKPSLILLRSIA